MTVFGWVYVVFMVFGIISNIGEIGKPRKAITHAEASASVLINIGLFAALYYWGIA